MQKSNHNLSLLVSKAKYCRGLLTLVDQEMLRIHQFPILFSTMTTAVTYPPNSAILASAQLQGKGRTGPWSSPSGGFYCTYVVEEDHQCLQKFSVGCSRLLGVNLKWPNDFMLNGKKCGGVLTQDIDGKTLVGVGINLSPADGFSYVLWEDGIQNLCQMIFEYSQKSNVNEFKIRCGIIGMNTRHGQIIDVVDGVLILEHQGYIRAIPEITSFKQLI